MADVKERKWDDPLVIGAEYERGKTFKQGLGRRGLYEQNMVNERFYSGDQWHGVPSGSDKPLVRYNVIKRIGDYKIAVVGASPVAVNYSADGVPNTLSQRQRTQQLREQASVSQSLGRDMEMYTEEVPQSEEINLVMSAMSDYFRVTAERVQFDHLKEKVLQNAYKYGTGVLYTYWDDRIRTGLYADIRKHTPIRGDIACEVLDIENVYFGDPNLEDLQAQPYILLSQRMRVCDVQREMRRFGQTKYIDDVKPDEVDGTYQAGGVSVPEEPDACKTTVITKLYKQWDKTGENYTIMGVKVCGAVTVRPAWDLKIRLYPLAAFIWQERQNCAYGDSEVTHLIPNQIAINRMITASVWAVMMMGIPIMVVNGDIVSGPVTNDPGQIVTVYGGDEDVARAIRYVQPPNFSPKFDENIASLVNNTLTQAGANDAALGDMRPENTSAIIAVREAATMPLQIMQNRFYTFIEDVARIWAEFWMSLYGKRSLKVEDENGVWYLPFDGQRYKDLLISVRTDVGASTLWSEAQSIQTLDNLFDRQVIDVIQYLKRLPKGMVPDVSALIRELQSAATPGVGASEQSLSEAPEAKVQPGMEDIGTSLVEGLPAEYRAIWDQLTGQDQAALLQQVLGR